MVRCDQRTEAKRREVLTIRVIVDDGGGGPRDGDFGIKGECERECGGEHGCDAGASEHGCVRMCI